MSNKQTAVEFLEKQYYDNDYNIFQEDFEQAKEMEKEQIIETWHNGYNNQSPMIDEDNCGQQYYKETYLQQ